MCWSIDRYNNNPDSQATYHYGHKIAYSLWQKWIRTVGRRILTIKKTSVETLQIRLYSVFLNLPIKHVQEKEKRSLIVKEKENSCISTSLQLQYWKKTKIMVFCQLCFLRIHLFWLTPCIFDFFYLRLHITIINW